MAWRDGAGCVAGDRDRGGHDARSRSNASARTSDLLLWRFPRTAGARSAHRSRSRRIAGRDSASDSPRRACLRRSSIASRHDPRREQLVRGARLRAEPAAPERALRAISSRSASDEQMRLIAEGEAGRPLRAVHVPADPAGEGAPAPSCCSIPDSAASVAQSSNLQALLDVLPIGLALVDRDGRFLTMNGPSGRPRDSRVRRCRSIPATSWLRKTRRRSPMPCAETPADRRCPATSRFGSRTSRRSRSR